VTRSRFCGFANELHKSRRQIHLVNRDTYCLRLANLQRLSWLETLETLVSSPIASHCDSLESVWSNLLLIWPLTPLVLTTTLTKIDYKERYYLFLNFRILGSFPSVKLDSISNHVVATHFPTASSHLVLRLRIYGAMRSLPHTSSWFAGNILTCCSCRRGETMSLNCGHKRAYCTSPRWHMSMESHGGLILTGETEELEEKPVPVPLCPSKILDGLTWREPGSHRWQASD
jgi:hypothetical protein